MPRFVLPQKQNFFSKTFRYAIKLDELYCVTKSFQGLSFYFYAHKSSQRPPFCFAQVYRNFIPNKDPKYFKYGTLEQNKMGDVVCENTHKNKRTSSKAFRLRHKAHRALCRSRKAFEKSFVFEAAQTVATSPYLSPPYKVLVGLPATLYRHYMVKHY